MTMLSEIVCVMNVNNQSCQSSVTCLSPFLTDIASLLTYHRMSGRPIRAMYTSISRQFVSKLLTLLQLIRVPLA